MAGQSKSSTAIRYGSTLLAVIFEEDGKAFIIWPIALSALPVSISSIHELRCREKCIPSPRLPRRHRGRSAWLALLQPLTLEPLPAVGDHRVSCGIWVGCEGELACQELCPMGREWLPEALTMIE